ncbi:hypothetical protein V1264_011126 [Littorina saxatilis]|uniref:Uncharacterized protein n=1 Tax=Littorina saxatilis TaxID=31220 RepID=A0AAN9BS41_9CAEN
MRVKLLNPIVGLASKVCSLASKISESLAKGEYTICWTFSAAYTCSLCWCALTPPVQAQLLHPHLKFVPLPDLPILQTFQGGMSGRCGGFFLIKLMKTLKRFVL